jgi:hypothetical protein
VRPTLLIDEGDSFIKDNEEMRGILNSGHTKAAAHVIRNGSAARSRPLWESRMADRDPITGRPRLGRLHHGFALSLHAEKTRLIEFGRFDAAAGAEATADASRPGRERHGAVTHIVTSRISWRGNGMQVMPIT